MPLNICLLLNEPYFSIGDITQDAPVTALWDIEGILPKGPYLPCVSMAGKALLAGYPRYAELPAILSSLDAPQAPINQGCTVIKRWDGWVKMDATPRTFVTTRSDSRFAPSHWESVLPCNDVSHWLGARLVSALTTFVELPEAVFVVNVSHFCGQKSSPLPVV